MCEKAAFYTFLIDPYYYVCTTTLNDIRFSPTLVGASLNPRSICSKYVHLLATPLMDFSQTCISTSPMYCMAGNIGRNYICDGGIRI